MVEGAPLLRVYTGNGIEGSNPFLFASAAMTQRILSRTGRPFALLSGGVAPEI